MKTKLRARYKEKYREVKRNIKGIKADKKKWMESIVSDAEEAARSQTTQEDAIRKNRYLVIGKEEVQRAGQNTLRKFLYNGEPANPIMDDQGGEYNEMIEELAVSESTPGKGRAAITKLQKAPGIDSITAELLKAEKEFFDK